MKFLADLEARKQTNKQTVSSRVWREDGRAKALRKIFTFSC